MSNLRSQQQETMRSTSKAASYRWLGPTAKYLILAIFAAISLYPVLLIVSTALKDPLDTTANPFALFSSVQFQNFVDAWTLGGFGQYFWTTVIITGVTVVAVAALSALAGYGLARFRFRGANVIFFVFMFGLMIPFFAVMIPLFYQLRDFGILGTKAAVILPAVAGAHGFGLPLGVFLMRAFFADLPEELADAARTDGCGEFRVFWSVMLPLGYPGLAILAVLVFFQTWNVFVLPLVFMPGTENQMLATGLYQFASGRTQEIEMIAAGSIIMVLPVLIFFLIFQRQFVKGITAGALK